jgi:hypothetical protein
VGRPAVRGGGPAGVILGIRGLEIACWGDHLDVRRAAEDEAYVRDRRDILEKHNLKVWTISNHLLGQAVCDDPIDQRHQAILPAHIWGNGDPEGVRQRAADEMKTTARPPALSAWTWSSASPGRRSGRRLRCSRRCRRP